MRILPALFYIRSIYGTEFTENHEAMDINHNISALTHAHKRSLIACGIYISVANMLIGSMDVLSGVERGIYNAIEYYKKHVEFADEIYHYNRLSDRFFSETPVNSINSSGYVVDTLEAAIWCLLNTKNYKDCVLLAVGKAEIQKLCSYIPYFETATKESVKDFTKD